MASLAGRYFYGDFCTGEIWSFRNGAGRAIGHRRETVRVSGLTSFGESATGELYAASIEGQVYRLELRRRR